MFYVYRYVQYVKNNKYEKANGNSTAALQIEEKMMLRDVVAGIH